MKLLLAVKQFQCSQAHSVYPNATASTQPHLYHIPANPYQYLHYSHLQSHYPPQGIHHPFNDPLVQVTRFSTSKKRPCPTTENTTSTSKRSRHEDQADKENIQSIEYQNRSLASPIQTANISNAPDTGGNSSTGTSMHVSLTSNAQATAKTRTASDVWYFMIPVSSKDKSDTVDIPKDVKLSIARPRDAAFIACRLCKGNDRFVWKCTDGQTSAIRTHLQDKHWKIYSETVRKEELKGWEDIVCNGGKWPLGSHTGVRSNECEPFTLDGFYTRLVKWIVVDDQSMNVIECPKLRDLLLYLNPNITDRDVPHRTKIATLIKEQFEQEYLKMAEDIQNALGNVSVTSDIWSRQNLCPHMGVTVHYMATSSDNWLVLHSRLVAFRVLHGSHTGERMAEEALSIFRELKILCKIGTITLDNASNNNTMMEGLARRLNEENDFIEFDSIENRIRCFPHINNICVKTGLKYMMTIPESDPEVRQEDIMEETEQPNMSTNLEYCVALESDVVATARKLVNACRASDLRRAGLRSAIREFNSRLSEDSTDRIGEVELLRDVDTRWSSTFLMIDRLFWLYPAVKLMLSKPEHSAIAKLLLSDVELIVLNDIRHFLNVFMVTQQIVSGDKTPTLSLVLPIFEELYGMLNSIKALVPGIAHGVEASIKKLEEYMGKARKTKAYALAMVINPTIKLQWANDNWKDEDKVDFKQTVRDTMLKYRCSMRTAAIEIPVSVGRRKVNIPSPSAQAQMQGHARMRALSRSLSSGSLSLSPLDSEPSILSRHISNVELRNQDIAAVDEELRRWISLGIITNPQKLEKFDLIIFWESHKLDFPILYRIALDILPAQASAVPCERVFSSSKETNTLRRSRLDSDTMERLQILKYLTRSQRLNFTEGLIATEDECSSVIDLDSSVLEDMIMTGQHDTLESLIDMSNNA